MERREIIAVDFDGTLCTDAWPNIGEAIQENIDFVLRKQQQGAKLILWTCRTGDRLSQALTWCQEQGLTFDTVNENIPEMVEAFGSDCRKVFADLYIDDKAYNVAREMEETIMKTIKLGQKVKFNPFEGTKVVGSMDNTEVIGEVTLINEENQWFQITYGKHNLRRCYKFADIGTDVQIIEDVEKHREPKGVLTYRNKKLGIV